MAIEWQAVEFRGIRVPFRTRRYGFTQRLAQHQYAFRDLNDIEMMGAENPRWNYSIPMGEGIKLKEWTDSNLLTLTLARFMRACFLSDPGELIDPLYGRQTVVPVSYSEELTTASREQADLEVEFMLYPTTPDLPITGQQLASLGVLTGATQAQIDSSPALESLPEDVTPPGGFVSALQQAQNYLALGEFYAELYTGQIEQYVAQLTSLSEAIAQASDPEAWLLQPVVQRLISQAQRIAANTEQATRNLAPFTVPDDMTLDALASLLGLVVDDLLRLNPQLAGKPWLPRGSAVRLPQPPTAAVAP